MQLLRFMRWYICFYWFSRFFYGFFFLGSAVVTLLQGISFLLFHRLILLIFAMYYWTHVHFCNCLHFLAELALRSGLISLSVESIHLG
jgi:hypothetical protein